MKNFFCIVFLCLAGLTSAQKKDTLRLYYPINSDAPDIARLDSFFGSQHQTLTEARIIGYADFLSTNRHNLSLSQRRANKVKQYILQKAKHIEVLECVGKGELAGSEKLSSEGVPRHRRVDIIYNTKVFREDMENFPTETNPKKKQNDTVTANKKSIADLAVGESMRIEGLSFIPGEHYLVREAAPALKRLLETLQKNPNIKIEIQGHVCCTKGGEDGVDLSTGEKKLSENRAKFIYDYLIEKGIDEGRLTYKGYGRTMPKAPEERNSTEEQMNRRVEIKILDK